MEESTAITLHADGITLAITALRANDEAKHRAAIKLLTTMRNTLRKRAVEQGEREYEERRKVAAINAYNRKKKLKGKDRVRCVRVDQIISKAHRALWERERLEAEATEGEETRSVRTDLTERDYDPETERGRALGTPPWPGANGGRVAKKANVDEQEPEEEGNE